MCWLRIPGRRLLLILSRCEVCKTEKYASKITPI
jgi:hypothetical protein